MKRLSWVLAAILCAGAALPAMAGGKGEKCTQDAQTCLNHFAAKKGKGWMGVELDKKESGAQVVTKVVAGAPAAEAGFEIGDVLVARNGIQLSDYEALKADKTSWNAGSVVTYTILRNEKEKKLAVTLAPMPSEVFAAMVGAHMVSDHLEEKMASGEAPAEKAAAAKAAAASTDK